MKNRIFLALAAIVALAVSSCKVDGLDKDPNRPTAVTPDLVFNGICNSIVINPWDDEARWCQYNCCNYNYYGNQEYNWSGASLRFTTLKNVQKMEEEAKRVGYADVNPYSAVGKLMRAYMYYEMTMLVGDLPLDEALNSSTTLSPSYATQKEVFVQILKWLDEANSDMGALISAGKGSIAGDIYFNGDLAAWQKANNAFTLRVLVALSKKESDADLNVKTKFSNIFSNPAKYPVFNTNGDGLQYVYNTTFNKYPTNPDNFGFDATRYNMSATTLNTLATLKDPRAMMFAEPAGSKLKGGAQPTDFSAFVGAESSMDLADMSTKAGTDNGAAYLPGEFSFYNRKRYYSTYTAENNIMVGYAEMCFNIAEAANRGWISASAKDWYEKGISASQEFYGVVNGPVDVYFFKPGGKVTDGASYNKYTINFDQAAYLAQPLVSYAGNNAQGLEQIVVQKYLAFFQNSGWEGYFNYRRTGSPAFSKGGAGTANSGLIPRRFQYPSSEGVNNKSNWQAALDRQFGGKDDINADMWILK